MVPARNPERSAIMNPVGLWKGEPSAFAKSFNSEFAPFENATTSTGAFEFDMKGLTEPSRSENIDVQRALHSPEYPNRCDGVTGAPDAISNIPDACHPLVSPASTRDLGRGIGSDQTK